MWTASKVFDSFAGVLDLELEEIREQLETHLAPVISLRQHQSIDDPCLPHGFFFPLDGKMQWMTKEEWGDRVHAAVMLPHQVKYLQDLETRSLGIVAGYGAGKTISLVCKAIQLAGLNQGYSGTLYSSTYELATQVLIPILEEYLGLFKIQYTYRATPLPKFILHLPLGDTTIFVRAFENQARIISYNLAWAGVDEIDTIKPELASTAWKKLRGRIRAGNVRQIFTASTPEGFRFMYQYFEEERIALEAQGKETGRRLIQASTRDNPFLPDDFLDDLLNEYPAELVDAYVDGHFVNMTGSTVYYTYNRVLSHTDRTLGERDILHVGMDFNVGQMAAIVLVDDPDETVHVVKELTQIFDTPAMIDELKRRFPLHAQRRMIRIYPDASGKARKTVGATQSDHSLLVQAGFMVLAPDSNPAVRDRINAVNRMFRNANEERRLFVNERTCPQLAKALEQQTWVDGQPDKSRGIDHPLDALGYSVNYRFPITSGAWSQSRANYG